MSINVNHTTNKIEQATGVLKLGTTPIEINAVGAISVNSSYGTEGQVLTTHGAGSVATWTTVSGGGGSYTLPIATASELGGIKVGSGLSIDGSGVLTATGGGTGGAESFNPFFLLGV
jgi:hypothetical protein